jgi:hypothetical protein
MRKPIDSRPLHLLGLTALASVLCAGTVSAGTIVGSAHDFTNQTWTDEICIVCHTPHNANTDVDDAPLWNHELTTKIYDLYDSPTFDATDIGQPTGASILCLSCHDGTVALDAFGGETGTVTIGDESPRNIGGDELANDHPISFTYHATLAAADGELYDPSTSANPHQRRQDQDGHYRFTPAVQQSVAVRQLPRRAQHLRRGRDGPAAQDNQ